MKKSVFWKGLWVTLVAFILAINALWFWSKHKAFDLLDQFQKTHFESVTHTAEQTSGYPFSLKISYDGLSQTFKENLKNHFERFIAFIPQLPYDTKSSNLVLKADSVTCEAFIWNPFKLYCLSKKVTLVHGTEKAPRATLGLEDLLLHLDFSKTGALESLGGHFQGGVLGLHGPDTIMIQDGAYSFSEKEGAWKGDLKLNAIGILNHKTKKPYWDFPNSVVLTFSGTPGAAETLGVKGDVMLTLDQTTIKGTADLNLSTNAKTPRHISAGKVHILIEHFDALLSKIPELQLVAPFILAPYKTKDDTYEIMITIKEGEVDISAKHP